MLISVRTHPMSRFVIFSAKSSLRVYLSQFTDHQQCLLVRQGPDPPRMEDFYWQAVVDEMLTVNNLRRHFRHLHPSQRKTTDHLYLYCCVSHFFNHSFIIMWSEMVLSEVARGYILIGRVNPPKKEKTNHSEVSHCP